MAQDFFKDGNQHGESLHIPVVVHSGHPVGIQVEGVDHIHIIQIRRGSLIGQVHRMIDGQIPNGEGFKLGIACSNPPLVLMIELAQAGGQFAAAGAGGRHHHQFPGGFNVIVLTKALVADDMGSIRRIAGNVIVMIHPDAHSFQTGLESRGHGLTVEPGKHHAGNIQSQLPENINQADHIPVIGDAQILPDFALFNIPGIDGNHHLHLVLHLQQHPQLAVRLKSRKHPGRMKIIIKLTAELQIQLAAEFGNPIPDMGRLGPQILIIIKCRLHHFYLLFHEITTDYCTSSPEK